MKPHTSYKAVNLKWTSNIPSFWDTISIKYLKNGDGGMFMDGDWIESKVIVDSGIRYLTTGNIGPGYYKEQGSGFISEDTFVDLNCTEVVPGDLVISRLNEPIGRACLIPELGYKIVTAVDNVILRPKNDFSRKYIMYVLNSKEFSDHTSILGRGATMKRISRGQLGNIKLPAPPLQEQTQIAKYLDYQTNIIDQLIEKKERLVTLLEEQRHAIINEAVTKGLDPNAKMKDSGIEWLGEIPEEWEVRKMKYFATINNGRDWKANSVDEGGYPVYGTGGEIGRVNDYLYDGPSVLLGRKGTIDKPQYIDHPFWSVDTAFYTVIKSDVEPYYFYLLCQQIQFDRYQESSAVPSMTQDKLNNIHLPMPPISIQREILNKLEKDTAILDSLLFKLVKQLEKLKEYRQSIISEAVTGKIDLREWEAPQNQIA